MSYLILDDVRDEQACFLVTGHQRYLQANWDIVKTYKEFVKYIQDNDMPKVISFDHDIHQSHYNEGAHYGFKDFNYDAVEEKTGYHAALWLIDTCVLNDIALPECYCHSMNPYGKMMIESAIRQYYKNLYKFQIGK
jgi:hypothetical protein